VNTEDVYKAISVFRDQKKHILIYDRYYPMGRLPNQYYDIHLGEIRKIDQNDSGINLTELTGEQRETACRIYMNWKWMDKKDFVIKQANQQFPLSGGNIPIPNLLHLHMGKEPAASQELKITKNDLRAQSIKNIVRERKITSLFHFTHINNLESIIKYGLLCRRRVEKLPMKSSFVMNDTLRLDGHVETISLSIGFPNYKMFYVYKKKPEEWIVIGLKPDILWELDCSFFVENAAKRDFQGICLEELKQASSLEKLFLDYKTIQREDLSIPDWFPTNPQAEVLVNNPIPATYFLRVYFFDDASFSNWLKNHKDGHQNLFAVEPGYFCARCDYSFWQKPNLLLQEEIPDNLPGDEIPF